MKTTQTYLINYELWTEELRTGSDAVFAKVYHHFYPLLMSHAYRMLKDEDDASDMVQELFIHLHHKRYDLPAHANLATYLYVSLRNRIISLIRKNNTYTGHIENFKHFADSHQKDVLEQLYEKDLAKIIQREIDKLPPRMKEIFELSRYEDLSYKEIGEKLNISPKTVKAQIRNALLTLRSQLPFYVFFILSLQMLVKRFFN